jgi:predicted GNAT family acetyltransferase
MSIEITKHDTDGTGRYDLAVDGQAAGEVTYRTVDGRRVFLHTGVRDEFEGQGLAGKLARRVLDEARADGVQIVPLCPYIAHYLESHPDDAAMVDEDLYAKLKG